MSGKLNVTKIIVHPTSTDVKKNSGTVVGAVKDGKRGTAIVTDRRTR